MVGGFWKAGKSVNQWKISSKVLNSIEINADVLFLIRNDELPNTIFQIVKVRPLKMLFCLSKINTNIGFLFAKVFWNSGMHVK